MCQPISTENPAALEPDLLWGLGRLSKEEILDTYPISIDKPDAFARYISPRPLLKTKRGKHSKVIKVAHYLPQAAK